MLSDEECQKIRDEASGKVWANFQEFCKQNADDLYAMAFLGGVDQLAFDFRDAPMPYTCMLLVEGM